jgi:hypothetical protein
LTFINGTAIKEYLLICASACFHPPSDLLKARQRGGGKDSFGLTGSRTRPLRVKDERREKMTTLSVILGLLCGITVAVAVLLALLGGRRLMRVIESDRGSVQAQFGSLRAELQSINSRLQAAVEKPRFVNKRHFGNEYELHNEVLDKLIELRYAATQLRPILDRANPSETEGDYARIRLHDFREAAQAYREVFKKNRLLYAGTVYAALFQVMDKCQTDSVQYPSRVRDWKEYEKKIRQNLQTILNAIEDSRIAISTRLHQPALHLHDPWETSKASLDRAS